MATPTMDKKDFRELMNNRVTRFNRILEEKPELYRSKLFYMLQRTQMMFEWSGLPDTIPASALEDLLQREGFAVVIEKDGKVYAVEGSLYAECDSPNELPTKAVVTNKALGFYESNLIIGKDCEVIRNDYQYLGLLPLDATSAALLTEGDITLRFAAITARMEKVFDAQDEATKTAVNTYLENIIEGRKIAAIGTKISMNDKEMMRVISDSSQSTAAIVREMIEYCQYIRGTWFNDIGLQANFNMKREAINGSEAGMNEESLSPLPWHWLKTRREDIEKVNRKFGLNLSVDFSSSWIARATPADNGGETSKDSEPDSAEPKQKEEKEDVENANA